MSSGTAALHLAMLSLGIGPGDEVIIPSLTFVADINVVKMVGATPVLADCSSVDDWNISPGAIARLITPRTKAVLVMHYAGFPCDMTSIGDILEENAKRGRRIFLVEDAAHAPGAEYLGKKCGTIGNIGCFSFFTNKNLSVGEGGMFVTSSEELDRKARHLRSHGMTSPTLDRYKGRTVSYDVASPGLNYRIDEMRAALGLVQLEKLPGANRQRAELFNDYYEALEGVPGLVIPFRGLTGILPAYHIFPILLPEGTDRLALIEHMKSAGIQTSIHYPSLQNFTAYQGEGLAATPVAAEISARQLTLPLYPTMTSEQVELVAVSLKNALGAV
jgi:dTDP-4-amino-4,6-dideoxygalactose transaminase